MDYLSPTLYATDLLILLILLIYLKNSKKLKLFFSENKKNISLILLLLLSGIYFSLSPLSGAYSFLKLCEFFLLFFYIKENIVRFKKILPVLLSIGIIFESLLSIAQFINAGSIGGIFYFFGERFFSASTPNIANALIGSQLILRPYGTFPHPNILAAYLLIGIIFILKDLSVGKNFKTLVYLAALSLGYIALFISLSRIAVLLSIIVIPLILIKNTPRKELKKRNFLALLIILVTISAVFFKTIFYRFLNLLLFDSAFTDRVNLIKASLSMIYKNPLLGVGLGNFLTNLPLYYKSNNFFFLQPVHNIFLFVGSETGLMGLFLFIWFFALSIKKARDGETLTLLSSIIIFGFFDHYFVTLEQGQLLFVLVLGYIWASQRSVINDKIAK